LEDSNDATKIANNFSHIGKALRSIGVKFSAKQVQQIMSCEPGVAVNVVYQIRMAASRLGRLNNEEAKQRDAVMKPVEPTGNFHHKKEYEALDQRHFEQQVKTSVFSSKKDEDMEHHLARFGETMRTQDAKARQKALREEQRKEAERQRVRRALIDKRKANERFKKDWEAQGEEKWRENVLNRRKAEEDKLSFEKTISHIRTEKKRNKKERMQDEVNRSLEQFEANLERVTTGGGAVDAPRGIDGEAGPSDEVPLSPVASDTSITPTEFMNTLTRAVPHSSTLKKVSDAEMDRIREKVAADRIARKERSRRRKKILVDQMKEQAALAEQKYAETIANRGETPTGASKQIEETCGEIRKEEDKARLAATLDQQREEDIDAQSRETALTRDRAIHAAEVEARDLEIREQHEKYVIAQEARMAARREANTKYCAGLAQGIADLATKAAAFRSVNNEKLVPPSVWREWVNLFVNSKAVLPTSISASSSTSSVAVDGTNVSEPETRRIDAWVSEQMAIVAEDESVQEYVDQHMYEQYLEWKHEWMPTTEETEQETEAEAADSSEAEKTKETQEDGNISAAQALGEAITSNKVLGSAIQAIVNVASGNLPKPQFPIVSETPLLVSVIGKPFSGKKTVASSLSERHDLQVIDVETLVKQALESIGDQKLKEKDMSEQQAIGSRIKKMLAKGKEIDDETYVELVALAVRSASEASPNNTEGSEAQDTATADEATKEESPENEASATQHRPKGGCVLVDFPKTYAQAAALEKALSGFQLPTADPSGVPEVDKKKRKSKRVSAVAPPTEIPALAEKPFPSALTAVLCLLGDNDTFVRRAIGRRFDPETDTHYHIDSNPPPEDEAIKERLVRVPGEEHIEQELPSMLSAWEEQYSGLQDWLTNFDVQHQLAGDAEADAVADASSDVIITAIRAIDEAAQARKDAIAEEERLAAEVVEKQKEQDSEEAKQIDAQVSEIEASRLEALEAQQAAAATSKKGKKGADAVKEAEVPSVSISVEDLAAASGDSPTVDEEAGTQDAPPSFDFSNVSHFRQFVDEEAAQVLADQWITFEKRYSTKLKQVFRLFRSHRLTDIEHWAKTRGNFLEFLARADTRQDLLTVFQDQFNQIALDMRGDVDVQDELHRRTDELNDRLWEITDKRREENEAELTAIREEKWSSAHAHKLATQYMYIAQLEIDRYVSSVAVARGFFSSLAGLPLPEEPTEIPTLPFEGEVAAPKKGGKKGKDAGNVSEPEPALPRVQQAIDFARSILIDAESETLSAEPVEASSKDKKGKKGDVTPLPASTVDPLLIGQLRHGIATENHIFSARIAAVLSNASSELGEVEERSEAQLVSMNQWIGDRIKGESDAIDSAVQYIKSSVEECSPLEFAVRLEGENVYVDQRIQACVVPPPVSNGSPLSDLPASAKQALSDAFNQSAPSGEIHVTDCIRILLQVSSTPSVADGSALVSDEWRSFDTDDFRRIVSPFVKGETQTVSVSDLLASL